MTHGILFLTTVALMIAKLAGWITVSWLIVFLPVLIDFAMILIVILLGLFAIVASFAKNGEIKITNNKVIK